MSTQHASQSPSDWIVRFSSLVTQGGRVLDLACGRGRHSRWFAARGCNVIAVDRDPSVLEGLAGLARVATLHTDLEVDQWPFAQDSFDAIVVTQYLHRPLFPQLLQALAGDGVLLYETFARGNEVYGKPSNSEFLLEDGELLCRVAGAMTVVAFEQGRIDADRPAVVQRLAAVGRGRAWPPHLPI